MPVIAVTGADGFLGWHTRCALKARGYDDVVSIGRCEWADDDLLDAALAKADAVIHLAGVNRGAPTPVSVVNRELATALTASLDRAGRRPAIVYANSIQSGNGTPFGDGKQAAADHLTAWGRAAGIAVADVHLPNLFGEHGRPNYNSVVATFSHALATGGVPSVREDREIPLLYVQNAVAQMLDLGNSGYGGLVQPKGQPMLVSQLLELLTSFRELYERGEIPDITSAMNLELFNTYRSFIPPQKFPLYPALREDNRGVLFECLRGHGGEAQVFCSNTRPGFTRGEHFHLRKVERFIVLNGTAEIALRRLFSDTVVRFAVTGSRPAIVDMPTMWAHSITNTGDDELTTLFWASKIFDSDEPDTFAEAVMSESAAT